jgi:hypothetical protein
VRVLILVAMSTTSGVSRWQVVAGYEFVLTVHEPPWPVAGEVLVFLQAMTIMQVMISAKIDFFIVVWVLVIVYIDYASLGPFTTPGKPE